MIYTKYRDSFSSGEGFVNNAFEDDEDDAADNRVTYARWINREGEGGEIELGVRRSSQSEASTSSIDQSEAEELSDALRRRLSDSCDIENENELRISRGQEAEELNRRSRGQESEELSITQRPRPDMSRQG